MLPCAPPPLAKARPYRTVSWWIVLVGRGGQHPSEDDDWWLHLYVMLSRATSLYDVLLLRAPEVDFLLRGPPADLRARLEVFSQRAKATHAKAEQIVRTMGWGAKKGKR